MTKSLDLTAFRFENNSPAAGWQPIGTAPKGTDVLVYWPKMELPEGDAVPTVILPEPGWIGVSRNDFGGWEPDNIIEANGGLFDDDFEYGNPTHWMPLPNPPEFGQ